MRVRLAVALVGTVVLAGCGRGESTVSRAADSVPTTSQPAESTTAPSTSTPAPSTTTAGGSTATTRRSPATTSATTTTAPRPGATGDFSVDYPSGWGPAGQVLATAFATGATCGSALIVDNAAPANSGPGASVEQSFVQVCWKGLEGKTLAQFMAATYGTGIAFETTTLAGRPAQVSRAGSSATYFLDTSSRRYQVTTGVAASDALRAARQAQVNQVLATLTLPT